MRLRNEASDTWCSSSVVIIVEELPTKTKDFKGSCELDLAGSPVPGGDGVSLEDGVWVLRIEPLGQPGELTVTVGLTAGKEQLSETLTVHILGDLAPQQLFERALDASDCDTAAATLAGCEEPMVWTHSSTGVPLLATLAQMNSFEDAKLDLLASCVTRGACVPQGAAVPHLPALHAALSRKETRLADR